jgi:glycosyltransferase involved in cell wall biosynthesis
VGMITCWYKNLAMSNYSGYLKNEQEKLKVEVEIITSRCLCEERYCGSSDIFQGECRQVSWPTIPFFRIKKEHQILFWLPHVLYQLLRGIRYLSQCKDCDVIHYQQSPPFSFDILPLIGLLLVPTSKVKIVTIHSSIQSVPIRCYPFLKKVYSRADRIIVHSNEQKMAAIKLGLSNSQIEVIQHGISNTKHLGVKRKEITFFGAPTERKGFFTILKALKMLREEGRSVNIDVYGIYSEGEKETAIAAAQNMGVGDLIRWNGRVSEAEFDKKMQGSLFTFAVYTVPVPGSSIITRALANGTPVIATEEIGGSIEYLGRAGIIICNNDPVALARSVKRLLDDERLRKNITERCTERGRSLLLWEEVAKRTLQIYLESMRKREMRVRA